MPLQKVAETMVKICSKYDGDCPLFGPVYDNYRKCPDCDCSEVTAKMWLEIFDKNADMKYYCEDLVHFLNNYNQD